MSAKQRVIFIHGLWLLSRSWDRWAELFGREGFEAVAPEWPDDAHIANIASHYEKVARSFQRKPVIIGHSFGGLLAQILAGRGCSAATVAIAPAPFQGVLPLPFSALRSAWPVLGNPANRNRAVPLTFEQFHYAFGNAVDEREAKTLFETFAVPAPGKPLFQAATANFDPWTEDKVDTANPQRGPLLLISGEKDHTVPPAVVNASFKLQQRNPGVTEISHLPDRGHSLTIDRGWEEVARMSLAFMKRFVGAREIV